ncbi:hypothetical protein CCAL13119_08905 [Campylobacter sp. RM13119]|uniref:hypothetical protein n=1 Tax=Campylobacter californiensis TaxID=1032243 RepID=UPI001474AD01|nr:hypothetical protein [Campylobacter sp. RM13119]MBE3607041.1 hypothetical protein [Campylobacter sp. RM13119]
MRNNIDKFDILVGKILAKLYEEFPIKCELVPENFGIKDTMAEFLDTPDGVMGDTKELEFLDATITWLMENEIITAKKAGFGAYYDARLTMKGLKLLKSTPKSIDSERKSIGESLKELSKAGANESLKIAVNALFSYGLSRIGLS